MTDAADARSRSGAASPGGWRRGLTARLAWVSLIIVAALSLIGSAIELTLSYRDIRTNVVVETNAALDLVMESAAEAAFQLNPTLAEPVTEGFLQLPRAAHVVLYDDFETLLAEGHKSDPGAQPLANRLFGDVVLYERPLDRAGLVVGSLSLTLSENYIAGQFWAIALESLTVGVIRTLAICLVMVAVFFLIITRPLVQTAAAVGSVDPKEPGNHLLPMPKGHRDDELGDLVAALNALLRQAQIGLDQRDAAERELTDLTHRLEDRVAERTRELERANEEIQNLNRRLTEENVRLGAELDVSRRIQHMVLPSQAELDAIGPLDIATFMEPADEVGGDYFDILFDGDRVRIGIGDVTGHGLESGVVMLMTQAAVRTLVAGDEAGLPEMLSILNRSLYGNVQRMGGDRSLSLALLDYHPDPEQAGFGRVKISGQHEVVLLIRDGVASVIDTEELGMTVALVDDVSPFLASMELAVQPGDTMILFTDGLTEAADVDEGLYGLDRLIRVASTAAATGDGSAGIRDQIIADVERHRGQKPLYDDISLIVARPR